MDRLLIIDDDVELCALIKEFLAPEFAIEAVHHGVEGAKRASEGGFALIVLDVMLPGMGGFEVLRRIRSASGAAAQTPILMLTARGDDVDRIVGLELGADDYLPKPFNPRELTARIHAILRRVRTAPIAASESLVCGDVELEPLARTVRRSGEAVELTAVEFELLQILMRSAGQVVTRDDLARRVLDRKWTAYDRSIDMHVSNVRKKLGPLPGGAERIKSVRSVGYILVAGGQ